MFGELLMTPGPPKEDQARRSLVLRGGDWSKFRSLHRKSGSNFAVPIRYGLAVLERAGLTLPEEKDGKEPETPTSQQNAHAALAPQ